jgi:hypothetical protein
MCGREPGVSTHVDTELKERLQNTDPYEFEHFVGDLWEEEGWSTTVSQASKDQGVDVIAEKRGTIDQKLAIQAKRYSEGNKVGSPQVQQYHSLKEQDTNADAAVVVTTSAFSKNAQLWAHENNVKLVDGDALVDMVQKHGAHDLVDDYAPELDDLEDEESSETATTEPTQSTSTSSSESASATGKEKWIFLALLASAGGLALAVAPSLVPSIPASVGTWAFALGWFTAPVFIFLDAVGLHRQDADTKPNRIVWAGASFFLPVLVPLWYLMNRA